MTTKTAFDDVTDVISSSPPDPIELTKVRAWLRQGTARVIREQNGLSLAEVAGWIGIHEATLSLWETGRRTPHGPRAIALLRVLERLVARS